MNEKDNLTDTGAPHITPSDAVPLLENRFLKAYDLRYAPGKHYYMRRAARSRTWWPQCLRTPHSRWCRTP